VEAPIPGLGGSPTHRLSVEVYQRHHDAGNGVCVVCGYRTPCLARRHAASIILAAGEDPRWYDAGSLPGTPRPADTPRPGGGYQRDQPEASGEAPPYSGYRLGGRGQPLDSKGFFYDRGRE
jgi:hypothetical protein